MVSISDCGSEGPGSIPGRLPKKHIEEVNKNEKFSHITWRTGMWEEHMD